MTSIDLTPDRSALRWRHEYVAFALLALCLALALNGAAIGMLRVWWETATYQHGFLVLPICGWMIWQRRAEFGALTGQADITALPLLLGSLTIAVLGEMAGVNLLAHIGLVGSLMALFPLCFGWALARRFWFPILFLGFMVPVGDALIAPLQELTADVSVWLLQLSGVPVYREGLLIELPSGLWEVAEACAGLRFLIANLFVAAIFAYLSYTRVWKWLLFAVLAVGIPVLANCLRAYGIMMLAHLTDNALAVGVDHLVYGWVFFSVVMLAMLWLGGRFADRGIGESWPQPERGTARPEQPRGHVSVLAAALIAATPVLIASTAPRAVALPDSLITKVLPIGWTPVETVPDAPDRWVPRFDSADLLDFRRVSNGTATIDVLLAAYTHQRDGAEATHWANRFDDDEIWKRARTGPMLIDAGSSGLGPVATLTELTYTVFDPQRGNLFKSRIVASWVIVGDDATRGGKDAKLAEFWRRLTGMPSPAAVFAVSTEYAGEPDRARAIAALEEALAALPNLKGFLLSGGGT